MAPIQVSDDGKACARALGKAVRKRREANGWTQEQLAEKTDLHRNAVGFLENGVRIPNVQTLMRVAKALEIPPSQLLLEAGY